MISDKNSVSNNRNIGLTAYKVVYFFAFPIIAFLAVFFALGLLFKSEEGYNTRLLCFILLSICIVLLVCLYAINSKLNGNEYYKSITYPFLNKFNPLTFLLLIAFLIITLFPFYVVLINSVKTSPEANAIGFTFFPKQGIIFDHYEHLFKNSTAINIDLVSAFFNSLLYASVPVVIGTFVSALSAYGFAKLNYPGRAFVYNFMIFTLMVPACVRMSSSYVLFDMFGWTKGAGISLPLIVPASLGGIGCVMFLREYFKGIPDDMLAAAKIDGCGKMHIFISIMIPLGMPAIIAQLVLGFIGAYNDYQSALIYLKYPIQYTVQLALSFFNRGESDKALAAAAAVFGIVPLLTLYIIFQNKIISGISFSAGLKG